VNLRYRRRRNARCREENLSRSYNVYIKWTRAYSSTKNRYEIKRKEEGMRKEKLTMYMLNRPESMAVVEKQIRGIYAYSIES
jgi:hypothetical protein